MIFQSENSCILPCKFTSIEKLYIIFVIIIKSCAIIGWNNSMFERISTELTFMLGQARHVLQVAHPSRFWKITKKGNYKVTVEIFVSNGVDDKFGLQQTHYKLDRGNNFSWWKHGKIGNVETKRWIF